MIGNSKPLVIKLLPSGLWTQYATGFPEEPADRDSGNLYNVYSYLSEQTASQSRGSQ